MALLGAQNVCLDSSVLSSCSSLRPSPNSQKNVVRFGRPVQCCCSRQDESSETTSTSRLSGLSKLAATGMMALAISTTSASGVAMAQQDQSLIHPVFNVADKADKLLKDADKLTNDDSPPRVGPSRGGVDLEDAGRVAQKGGSGAIPEIQGSGSELVGQARDKISEKASTTRRNLDETVGKAQDKAGDAKRTIDGFFGKAKSKVGGDIDTTKGSGDDFKGLVGDARNKVQGDAENAGDSARNLVGNIKKGLRIQ